MVTRPLLLLCDGGQDCPLPAQRDTMASNTYTVGTKTYKRSVKQGRKPQGLTRWNGRLTTSSLEVLKAEAEKFKPYYTVSDLVRIAVDKYAILYTQNCSKT